MSIQEFIEAAIESNLEYMETHEDSGNSYLELINESNYTTRIIDWLKKHSDTELELYQIDNLHNLVIDNAEVVSKHMYSQINGEDYLYLDHFMVSEVECFLEYAAIEHATGEKVNKEVLESLTGDDYKLYDGHLLAYTTSDMMWSVRVDKETMEQLVKEVLED